MEEKSSLKAILFDLDGTLINSLPVYVQALQDNIHEFTGREIGREELRTHIGTPTPRILSCYASEAQIPAMVERHNALFRAHSDRITFYPGAREALRTLRAGGAKIAVVTSQIAAELAITRAAIGLDELVDVWVNSDMAAHPKPAADPVLLALDLLGEQPHSAVMVGDTTNDLRAGRAAGALSAAVAWGFGRLPDLLACSPDLVLNRPEEIAELPERTRSSFSSAPDRG